MIYEYTYVYPGVWGLCLYCRNSRMLEKLKDI